MDKTEQALFEAHAVLQAHAELMMRLCQGQFDQTFVENLRSQLERLDVAHKAFLALPRPIQQQKAA